MHPIGAHSHLFRGPPEVVAAAFRDHGLTCVQLTPGFPGQSFREPGRIAPDACRRVAEPFRAAGVAVAAVALAEPLLDPDLERRHRVVVRLHALLRHARDFGTDQLVAETGSLNAASPWLPHAPNRSREAWAELRLIVGEALRVAADAGVRLLLKPALHHVLAGTDNALRLRDELGSPCLGFALDPADLLLTSPPATWAEESERAVDRLGPWAPLLHAKDLRAADGDTAVPRVGAGQLDYARLLARYGRHQPRGAIVLEHLRPGDVTAARAFVEEALSAPHAPRSTSQLTSGRQLYRTGCCPAR